jgi:molybdopterin biosynthesis enzyme
MGDFDPVKAVLGRIADMRWMQIAIKPAKPFAFGVLDGVPVFGLPGNPVSSVVSFELLARPALRRMAGLPFAGRPTFTAVAGEGFRRREDGKTHYVRVRVDDSTNDLRSVRSTGGQGSHQMSALASADGLAVLPDGPGVEAGERLQVIPLD